MRLPKCLMALATVGSLLLPGCAGWWPEPGRRPGSAYTEQDLADDLRSYAAQFSAIVSGAADEIHDRADSRRARRGTLVWKLRLVPAVYETAFEDDPQEAYVETLGLAIAQHQYLSEGDGRKIFGDQQPLAVNAARELEEAAREIGTRFLDEPQMARLVGEVEGLARRSPIRGPDFSLESARKELAKIESGSSGLGWVIGIPMSPFRALEGVGTTGTAMLEINRTAAEFSEVIEALPLQNRWQIELLLYDIEERDTVSAGLAAFQQVAESADRVSLAVARLPDDLRVALADSEGALGEANRALLNARELMGPVTESLERVEEIARIVVDLQGEPAAADAEPGRPFDVREYQATAREVGATVGELRALLAELDEVVASGRLEGTVLHTVDRGHDELAQLVDHAKMASIQVLGALFLLLFAYRLLGRWLTRSAS